MLLHYSSGYKPISPFSPPRCDWLGTVDAEWCFPRLHYYKGGPLGKLVVSFYGHTKVEKYVMSVRLGTYPIYLLQMDGSRCPSLILEPQPYSSATLASSDDISVPEEASRRRVSPLACLFAPYNEQLTIRCRCVFKLRIGRCGRETGKPRTADSYDPTYGFVNSRSWVDTTRSGMAAERVTPDPTTTSATTVLHHVGYGILGSKHRPCCYRFKIDRQFFGRRNGMTVRKNVDLPGRAACLHVLHNHMISTGT